MPVAVKAGLQVRGPLSTTQPASMFRLFQLSLELQQSRGQEFCRFFLWPVDTFIYLSFKVS